MPRGYLRRKAAGHGIGRKKARGGSSRRTDFYPNLWPWRDKDHLQALIDDEINAGIEVYFAVEQGLWDEDIEFSDGPKNGEEFHSPSDLNLCKNTNDRTLDSFVVVKSNDSIKESESFVNDIDDNPSDASCEESEETDSFFDVEAFEGRHHYTTESQSEKKNSLRRYDSINENGNIVNNDDGASDASFGETDSFFDVEVAVGRPRYTTGSQSEQDYSLCGASFQGSESFSLISTPTSHKEDIMDASTASTPWEIVAGEIAQYSKTSNCDQGVIDLHVTFPGSANNGEEGDSVSCISAVPAQAEAGLINDAPPRLFVPKQCAICMCEKKDVLRLMHKCHHPEACISCLRTFYVDGKIKNDSEGAVPNLPFKCFWPGCNRVLRDVQIRPLVRNEEEMKIYYGMVHRAKETRREARLQREIYYTRLWNFKVLQECSKCSTTNPVYPAREEPFCCSKCNTIQKNTVMSREEANSIFTAVGDVIVNCPACETLIMKDGGCDHMTCICGRDFSFTEARKCFDIRPVPAVPKVPRLRRFSGR